MIAQILCSDLIPLLQWTPSNPEIFNSIEFLFIWSTRSEEIFHTLFQIN